MNTAVCLEKHLDGWKGHANFYKLSPGIRYETIRQKLWAKVFGRYRVRKTEYVILSTVHDDQLFETFIFPCDYKKKVLSWGELPGSQRDESDHFKILEAAGYLLVE